MVVAALIPVVTFPETMTMILSCGHADNASAESPAVPVLTKLGGATPAERFCWPCFDWMTIDAFRFNV
jgi:hypothetical protein